MPETEQTVPDLGIERTGDLIANYANNVRFEASIWDLKLIFGQLDQSVTPNVVRQYLSVTVPWQQVKLMVYYLYLNLLINEGQNGTVNIPESIRPVKLDDVLEKTDDPAAQAVLRRIESLRSDLGM